MAAVIVESASATRLLGGARLGELALLRRLRSPQRFESR